LEARPNSGIYLRRASDESSIDTLAMLAELGEIPSPIDIRESIEVRTILELEGVKLACERRTEADLARLSELVQMSDQMIARGENFHELDTAFHLALATASHNSVLVRVLNSFYLFSAGRRRALFDNMKRGKVSTKEHRALLAAVQARNVKLAQTLISAHIQRGIDYWTQMLGDA
ncbi:MAG: FCD domain-containing protein, partial [Burkholderiaceae bacterium]|nr:FCD domain-containing protein [Burkholderiaceae bacterium]